MPDGGKDFRLDALMPGRLNAPRAAAARVEISNQNKALDTNSEAKQIDKAAQDFEALLLQQMFKSMWNTIPASESMLGSREEEYYRDFLNEELAREVSSGQGIGIKAVIKKDIQKLQKE